MLSDELVSGSEDLVLLESVDSSTELEGSSILLLANSDLVVDSKSSDVASEARPEALTSIEEMESGAGEESIESREAELDEANTVVDGDVPSVESATFSTVIA